MSSSSSRGARDLTISALLQPSDSKDPSTAMRDIVSTRFNEIANSLPPREDHSDAGLHIHLGDSALHIILEATKLAVELIDDGLMKHGTASILSEQRAVSGTYLMDLPAMGQLGVAHKAMRNMRAKMQHSAEDITTIWHSAPRPVKQPSGFSQHSESESGLSPVSTMSRSSRAESSHDLRPSPSILYFPQSQQQQTPQQQPHYQQYHTAPHPHPHPHPHQQQHQHQHQLTFPQQYSRPASYVEPLLVNPRNIPLGTPMGPPISRSEPEFPNINDDSTQDDTTEDMMDLDMDSLRSRGKGVYKCHHGKNCTKGGVDAQGNIIVFERNCMFRQHMDKHRKPFKCNLPGCPNKDGFARKDQLERHIQNVRHERPS